MNPKLWYTNATGDSLWETLGNWNTAEDGSGDAPTAIPWVDGYYDYDLVDTTGGSYVYCHYDLGLDITGSCDLFCYIYGAVHSGTFIGSYTSLNGYVYGGTFSASTTEFFGPWQTAGLLAGDFNSPVTWFWGGDVVGGNFTGEVKNYCGRILGGVFSGRVIQGTDYFTRWEENDIRGGDFNISDFVVMGYVDYSAIAVNLDGVPFTGEWQLQNWVDGAWVSKVPVATWYWLGNASTPPGGASDWGNYNVPPSVANQWACLQNWNTAADGSGLFAPSIPWMDDYFDSDLVDTTDGSVAAYFPYSYNTAYPLGNTATGTCDLLVVNQASVEIHTGNFTRSGFTNSGGSIYGGSYNIDGFTNNTDQWGNSAYIDYSAITINYDGTPYTGTWQGQTWVDGIFVSGYPDGWDEGTQTYYLGNSATTLDQDGNGFWTNPSLNNFPQEFMPLYYESGMQYTGAANGSYYIEGMLTGLDSTGTGILDIYAYQYQLWENGWWSSFSGYLSQYGAYFLYGGVTTLDENGNGWWDGYVYGTYDTSYWTDPAYWISGEPTTLDETGTGTWNGVNYVNGVSGGYADGWNATTQTYYLNNEATTLDQIGNGVWNNTYYVNGTPYTGVFDGSYYLNGVLIRSTYGWDAATQTYYVNNEATTLPQSGTGVWSRGFVQNPLTGVVSFITSTFFYISGFQTSLPLTGTGYWNGSGPILGGVAYGKPYEPGLDGYYISGEATTLDQNGNGVWNGTYYVDGSPGTGVWNGGIYASGTFLCNLPAPSDVRAGVTYGVDSVGALQASTGAGSGINVAQLIGLPPIIQL